MNCLQFKQILVDCVRQDGIDDNLLEDATAHISICRTCESLFKEQESLTQDLKDLGRLTKGIVASEWIENSLKSTFRQKYGRQTEPGISVARKWAIAALFAFAIFGAALFYYFRFYGTAAQRESLEPVKTIQSAKAESGEIATQFIPLTYGGSVSNNAEIVRMRLPRYTLLQFGFPMNESLENEPVVADVLIGEDGLPRAIRFVQQTSKVQSYR